MPETNDYDPGAWTSHGSFTDARKAYDSHAGRSYADAKTAGVKATSCVPDAIVATATRPLVVACDVTGSMGEWPAVMFSKLPYLDIEGKSYLGPDMQISFMAVGDVMSDQYPLQVQPFGSGPDELPKALKNLIIEGGGGGNQMESYDVAALYCARNVMMPNVKPDAKPIMIFIGDEGLQSEIEKRHAKMANVTLKDYTISVRDVFEELKRKFSVYIVRKEYSRNEAKIQAQWVTMLGANHVIPLEDPNRIVDVIFGILAGETNQLAYFTAEITSRQTPEQVKTVFESLKSAHFKLPLKGSEVRPKPLDETAKGPLDNKASSTVDPIDPRKSVTLGLTGGKKSVHLLGGKK